MFKKRKIRLSQAINWDCMLSPDVIDTKSGGFLTTLRYQPPDASCASRSRLVGDAHAISSALMRIPPRWATWIDQRNDPATDYHTAEWPDPISAAVDYKRREMFEKQGNQHIVSSFVSLMYQPDWSDLAKIGSKFATTEIQDDERRLNKERDIFKDGVENFTRHFESTMPVVSRLRGDELTTYLHSCVSTDNRFVRAQPDLRGDYLCDQDFIGGFQPMIGDHHIRIIKIVGSPSQYTPAILDGLKKFAWPWRICSRWIPLERDHAEAELSLAKRLHQARIIPFKKRVLKHLPIPNSMKPQEGNADDENLEAKLSVEECREASITLASGDITYGFWTHIVSVMEPCATGCNTYGFNHHCPSIDTIEDKCRKMRAIMADFVTILPRDTFTSVWMGHLPGHPHGDLRRMTQHSYNVARVLPVTATWTGPDRDHHLDGPPMIRCISQDGVHFNLCLHQPGSDVGHALILGRTGGGKSALLSSMMFGHRKYERSRIRVIDFFASAKCTTLALGGSFYDLAGPNRSVSLQPLADIHIASELAWANEFVLQYLRSSRINDSDISAHQKNELTLALHSMASDPVIANRTFTVLRALIQDDDVRDSLLPLCAGGSNGDLLDNDHKRMGLEEDVICYETSGLRERPSALWPVMACVFHEISRGFNGDPILLVIDEAQTMFDNPFLSAQLKDWLEMARKANVAIIMATPSVSNIAKSGILDVIASACQTKLCTAIPNAMEDSTGKILTDLGYNDEQRLILSRMRKKHDYAMLTEDGNWRVFQLGKPELSGFELSFVGKSRPEERTAMDEILRKYPRNEFAWRWLEHLGRPEDEIARVRPSRSPQFAYALAAE